MLSVILNLRESETSEMKYSSILLVRAIPVLSALMLSLALDCRWAVGDTFKAAIELVKSHDSILVKESEAEALREKTREADAFSDPVFSTGVTGYTDPESLKSQPEASSKTPSSVRAVEVGISQKLSLMFNYSKGRKKMESLTAAKEWERAFQERVMVRSFWELLIEQSRAVAESSIISDGINWLMQVASSAKSQYKSGSRSQADVLALKVRLAEMKSMAETKRHEINDIKAGIKYLTGGDAEEVSLDDVPWQILKFSSRRGQIDDPRANALSSIVSAKSYDSELADAAMVPDLTIGLSYTKMLEEIPGGDLISLKFSMPIPVFSKTRARSGAKGHTSEAASSQLDAYLVRRRSLLSQFKVRDYSLRKELKALDNEILVFATNSRDITAKSYASGKASFAELLHAEMTLLDQNLKKKRINADRLKNILDNMFIRGERIGE